MAPPPTLNVETPPPSEPHLTAVPPPALHFTADSPLVALLLRLLTFACALISIVVLVTATGNLSVPVPSLDGSDVTTVLVKVRYNNVVAYRYMLAAAVLGALYTLLQVASAIYQLTTGNRLGHGGLYHLDFYGDKLVSYILATGAAAGFGVTKDLKEVLADGGVDDIFNKGNASAALLLVAFLFAAISSVLSSLALPKRG